jgi:hypothetical protein
MIFLLHLAHLVPRDRLEDYVDPMKIRVFLVWTLMGAFKSFLAAEPLLAHRWVDQRKSYDRALTSWLMAHCRLATALRVTQTRQKSAIMCHIRWSMRRSSGFLASFLWHFLTIEGDALHPKSP